MVLFSVWLSAGIITLSKWCEAMETATHLGLPWRLLREKLAPIQSEAVPTDVHYTLTLQMLDTDLIVSTCNCNCIYSVYTKFSRLSFRKMRDEFRSSFREQFGFSQLSDRLEMMAVNEVCVSTQFTSRHNNAKCSRSQREVSPLQLIECKRMPS